MNENVRIITDSGCDISPAMEEKYKDLLVIMPFELTINGKGYTDRKDFTNDEFFKILKENSEIPKHSQITPIRFEEKYREEFGEDAELLPKNLAESKHLQVKTPEVTIKVSPGCGELVETRVIDGVRYILVRADGDVAVNGVSIQF
jgi:hypothetical protein